MDHPLLITLVAGALVVAVLMALTAVRARLTDRWAVVDVTWGLGFVAISWCTLILVLFKAHQSSVALLLLLLTTLWGGRLAAYILIRSRGLGEDPRYQALRDRGGSLFRVLATQGVVLWFVALPLMVGPWGSQHFGVLTWLGVGVWALGMFFEVVGDAQLRSFKSDPANKGRIMDRGLWRWTRHPNYFGDACVMTGLWLIAAGSGLAGALTVLSPIAMAYFLIFVTGAKLLEKSMMQRPGYPEYAARTSMFFPLPPKRG